MKKKYEVGTKNDSKKKYYYYIKTLLRMKSTQNPRADEKFKIRDANCRRQ